MVSLATIGVLPIMAQPKCLHLTPSYSHSHYHAQTFRLPVSTSQALGASLSSSTTLSLSASFPLVYCGRGDKKTARGKRFRHSYGNARPRNKKKGRGPPRIPVPSLAPKKDLFDDGEVVKIDIDEANM